MALHYPSYTELTKSREMLTTFGGYNHTINAAEGEFFEMKNMTGDSYPVLSPRPRRAFCRQLTNCYGILDKGELAWIDDNDGAKLYIGGEEIDLHGLEIKRTADYLPKTMTKMGAYLVILPDGIWYNTNDGTSGLMDNVTTAESVQVSLADGTGKAVAYQDEAYYKEHEPSEGDYKLVNTSEGKTGLYQWSATTRMWAAVATTYIKLSATGIGVGFKKGDGVKVTCTETGFDSLFPNEEEDGQRSNNFSLSNVGDDYLVVPGIIGSAGSVSAFTAARKAPAMPFVTECQNRLWGCSADGHELYCCKLGDPTNWTVYAGNSLDAWAATVGSDGKFTGAITYNGYPTFFKEGSMIRIQISAAGAHQTRETQCRGVQEGSDKSLVIINDVLFYKSTECVCSYNGSVPFSVSEQFGEVRYHSAAAGAIRDKYYLSVLDEEDNPHLFVFNTKKGLWHREDSERVRFFCRHDDELYIVTDKDQRLMSVNGTYSLGEPKKEGPFTWMVESGTIGYGMIDQKYCSRVTIRIAVDVGSYVDFWIQYDSTGEWVHKGHMAGSGTRSFLIPIIPRRCDHFKYKLTGKGEVKIYSIAKTIEQGGDVS